MADSQLSNSLKQATKELIGMNFLKRFTNRLTQPYVLQKTERSRMDFSSRSLTKQRRKNHGSTRTLQAFLGRNSVEKMIQRMLGR